MAAATISKMKKGQEYVGTVERVDFPNKGIVMIENEKVIVKNTIPGQKVRFQVNKLRKGKAEGRLLEVIEKSEKETKNGVCQCFGECGGCTYQSLPYEEQLAIKEAQVKGLLDPVCDDYVFEGIIGSPVADAYRNKMEFSFGDEFKDGPLSLGLHKRGSFYDILNVTGCQIVDEDYSIILNAVLHFFKELNATYFHKISHEGYLRHLLVRKAVKTGEILVNLITTSKTEIYEKYENESEMIQAFLELLQSLPLRGTLTGVLHTYNDSNADVVKCDKMDILFGRDFIYEELLGLKFKISTFSFFQTNSLGAEVLYTKAREYVGETKDKVIFDLYSGTGTIAQLLAPVAKKVIGVEIVEEAVEAAKINAELNGLTNCEFIAGDVLKAIDDINVKPDFIVLDPPRDGLHPKALEKICTKYGSDRMVYISCKPTSLARDLVLLKEQGYHVEKACCVDMFPSTVHVECVTLLQRKDI